MIRLKVALAAFIWFCAAAVQAQDYPARPVHLIVPFPPGGPLDISGRLIAQNLQELWKQPVIVENKPGGTTGTDYLVKSAADGYTLMIASASHALNPALHRQVNYHPTRDFQAITMGVSFPFVLAVTNSLPVTSFMLRKSGVHSRIVTRTPPSMACQKPGVAGSVGMPQTLRRHSFAL